MVLQVRTTAIDARVTSGQSNSLAIIQLVAVVTPEPELIVDQVIRTHARQWDAALTAPIMAIKRNGALSLQVSFPFIFFSP